MPRIKVKNKDKDKDQEWIALEHGVNYRLEGPRRRTEERSIDVEFDFGNAKCFLGEMRNGTRVSFQYPNDQGTWWHITQGDQPERNRSKPNFYPIVEKLIEAKK